MLSGDTPACSRQGEVMAQVHIDGTALEYLDAGRGDTVVLVHGSASDYRTWRAQTKEFAERHRVIAYSRRYHWPNKPIPEGADYSMLEHVEDLRMVLKRLDAAPAHLVGHSYGGFVSLLLAHLHPELVRSLILTEPPVMPLFVSNTPTPIELLRLFVTRPAAARAVVGFGMIWNRVKAAARRDDMAEVMRLTGTAVLGRDAFRRLRETRREQVLANQFKAEFLGSGFVPITPREVSEVRKPTLLVNGECSPRLWHYVLDKLEELLPNSERVRIPNASHIAHEDNVAAFNAAVISFWARHGGPE
jgi:pimeloyl-ACP methyl ester carboxylesterase